MQTTTELRMADQISRTVRTQKSFFVAYCPLSYIYFLNKDFSPVFLYSQTTANWRGNIWKQLCGHNYNLCFSVQVSLQHVYLWNSTSAKSSMIFPVASLLMSPFIILRRNGHAMHSLSTKQVVCTYKWSQAQGWMAAFQHTKMLRTRLGWLYSSSLCAFEQASRLHAQMTPRTRWMALLQHHYMLSSKQVVCTYSDLKYKVGWLPSSIDSCWGPIFQVQDWMAFLQHHHMLSSEQVVCSLIGLKGKHGRIYQ